MFSQDAGLANRLASELIAADGSIEIQLLAQAAHLHRHLQALHPDVLVLDIEGVESANEMLPLGRHVVERTPTVVVDRRSDGVRRQRFLAQGAIDYIAKSSGDYPEAVRDAVHKVGRLLRIGGRQRETERHFQDILDASSDGIFVLIDGTFRYVNDSFAQSLECPSEALVGQRDLLDFVTPETRQHVGEQLAGIEADDEAKILFDMWVRTQHGDTRSFELSCRSSTIDGHRAVVGVARDTTRFEAFQQEVEETRRRAAQVERLRALGELSAGVAHDFNNALGAILGRLTLAREKLGRGQSIREDLAVIEGAAENAAALVERIQDFARPNRRDRWEQVNLSELTQQTAEFVRVGIPKRISLTLDVHPTYPVKGNAEELREVLINLVRNAVDAIDGTGAIVLGCRNQQERVALSIQDTGRGMPNEVRERIFEPFFTTKGTEGTGLGLSVSHWILRRHDANIHVETAPNAGTLFRITFSPLRATSGFKASLRKKQLAVVVVEDDASIAEMVRDILQERGHRVALLSNIDETERYLRDHIVDLVLTDLDLHHVSGWQLARHVRRVRPEVAVGLMTGWRLDLAEEDLTARGIDFVLTKPFGIDALDAALAALEAPAQPAPQ